MNSRMLDVAIGLALVFATTSLLTTALQELWTSMRGHRGRFLQQALVSFFGNDKAFTDQVLQHPLVVSMSPQTKDQDRSPSYLHADVMVSALIAHLVEQHTGGFRPTTPGELVSAIQFAAPDAGGAPAPQGAQPNAEFLRGLTGLVMGVEHDWPAYEARLAAWYDNVCSRSIGWFKRHTQMTLFIFGLLAAALANINPLVITSHLWNDEALRKATVDVATKVSDEHDKSIAAAAAAAAAAGTAPQAAASPVAAAPPRFAQASATRDKLAALSAQLEAAVPLAKAHGDEAVRQGLTQALTELITLRALLNAMREPPGPTATANALDQHAANKAHARGVQAELRNVLPTDDVHNSLADAMKALDIAIQNEFDPSPVAKSVSAPTPVCAKALTPTERDLCQQRQSLAKLQAAGLPIGWDPSACRQVLGPWFCGMVMSTKGEDIPAHLNEAWQVQGLLLAVLGWCITAVACTLGAPFWFDLLSQLIKLRGSGGKPDAAAGAGGKAGGVPNSLLARSPATAEAASALPAALGEPMSDALNDAEKALSEPEVQRLQRALALADAQVSGHFDASTRAAIKQWQSGLGLASTGELTDQQIQQLMGLAPGSNDDGYLA